MNNAWPRNRAAEYHKKAHLCVSLARRIKNDKRRIRLIDQALYWLRLAHDDDILALRSYEWPPQSQSTH